MNLTHLIKIWLLMAIVALSANGAVKANVASGPQNLGLEVHQGKSIAKPLMRQGKSQVSTTGESDIFIEEDTETGLLYAKARYYDADTGKFLSEDAWEGDNMIAPSLHRYLYAYQNPTVYVDRDGNAPVAAQAIQQLNSKADNYSQYALEERRSGHHRNATGASILSGANRAVGVLVGVVNAAADLVISTNAIPQELKGYKIPEYGMVADSRANLDKVGKGISKAANTAANFHKREVRARLGTPLVETAIGVANNDPESLNKLASGAAGSIIGSGVASKVLPTRNKGGGNSDLVTERSDSIVSNAEGYMGNGSFIPSGSTVHHGKHSTAIGSDDATLGNFKQATNTGNGHNVIVHGERRYDNNGGAFSVDGQPTNSQQIVDAVKGNPNYKKGSPVCLGSCWSGSNGTAQEVANGLKAPVTAPTVPTRFNDSRNKWELMSDDQLPLDVDFTPEWKTFTPEKP